MSNIQSRPESGDDNLHTDSLDSEGVSQFAASVRAAAQALPPPPPPPLPPPPSAGCITPPPGFAGQLAQFIYSSAPRPVPEVAIVGALGLLAGIVGRQWCLPGTGLNIYIVLVARSATGKEAMHTGVSKLLSACRSRVAMADQFVSFDDFASGQALVKGCLAQPSFVNIVGEIGHKFHAMAKDTDPAMRTLRRTMTNLYSKSGPDAVAGGIAYSNQENNASVTFSVAYSVMGETTPAKFYESITSDVLADGFLSRFTVVQYEGDRPEKNAAPVERPDDQLVTNLVNLMQQAQSLMMKESFQPVGRSPEAAALMEAFESECDQKIHEAGDDEAQRQMWNRAHLKTLRIAALLAVADNFMFPTISAEHFAWAMDLTRRDIQVFSKRLQSGDIGDGTDDGRERKLVQLCCEYVAMRPEDVPGYGKPFEALRQRGIVTRKYLQIRTQRLAAFEKHPRGGRIALDTAIQTAIDNGHLMPMNKGRMESDYGFKGKAYALVQAEQFRTLKPQDENWQDTMLKAMDAAKQ